MCTRVWLLLLVGALGVRGAPEDEETRQIYLQFNPGFSNSSVNLLHTRAVGNGSTIHYVWSTIGAPTVLLIYTETPHSDLRVNWTKLLSSDPSGAITMDPADSVLYSTALTFTRIFEYRDVNNTANFSGTAEKYFYPPYDLGNFVWENANDTLNASSSSFRLTGVDQSDPTGSFRNGSVSFRVSAYDRPGRDASAPRLLHTANCTKLEFMISGVQPRGNHSRFALEMVTLEKKSGHKKVRSVRSIDDEYTPTIFEVVELVSDAPNASHARGYFQWKSVAYGSVNGTRADSLPCAVYKPHNMNGTLPVPSIIQAFYGEQLSSQYNLQALNVSYGIADGDFYDKNKFLGWSVLVGYGAPPRDSFSILVICIMAVALGIPLLLLIMGAILVLFMKKQAFTIYEPIN
ncbi:glycosylated lysosomal membrane protein [Hyla sarda]|uniref:glycosylated lysosomal membrane protein n=1 Tax=Hyla sarda TaxID=327740 RepID=UPI0024C2FB02|nr:glycosylated lysosomal membrane protein [Hyla sarda]